MKFSGQSKLKVVAIGTMGLGVILPFALLLYLFFFGATMHGKFNFGPGERPGHLIPLPVPTTHMVSNILFGADTTPMDMRFHFGPELIGTQVKYLFYLL